MSAASIRKPSLILLGLLTAVDAMAIDSYVPALPAIQRDLGVSAASVQATLSIFFIGVAIGQAVWGPVSDRLGRRKPMLAGLLAFVLGTVIVAVAPDIGVMLAGRFCQAIGASAALVLARAIVSDAWPEAEASRIYSKLAQVLGFTALISPLIGSGLLTLGSWRWIFAALAVIGVVAWLWTRRTLPETLAETLVDRTARDGTGSSGAGGYATLLRAPGFLRAVLVSALAMGTMFVVLTGSSFLFIGEFGWSPGAFSVLYAATSLGFIGTCQLNIMALRRRSAGQVLRHALIAQFVLAAVFAGLILTATGGAAALALIVLLLMGLLGFILGNSVAAAMARAPAASTGAASGLIGLAQFVLSAAVAPLATIGSSVPVSTAMTLVACAAAACTADLLDPARYPRQKP